MKLSLVLEGGASRAYFSVGVMDVLMREGIKADYVIGVSAGIANGVSYVSNQPGRGYRLLSEFVQDKRYMGIKHMFNPKNRSYYNLEFAFREIPDIHLPFDYETYSEFDGDVIAVTTNMATGKAEYLDVKGDSSDMFKIAVASCALPGLIPPTEINGKMYLDGGIADPIPLKKAVDDGCDKHIVVLTREPGYLKSGDTSAKLAKLFYRKHPNLVDSIKARNEVYNKSRSYVYELENEGKALIFAPKSTSDWKRTERSSDMLKKIYNEGYETAEKLLPDLYKFLEK